MTSDLAIPSAEPTQKQVRAARLAHVLARAVRDGEVDRVDARRDLVHELRRLNTNKTQAILVRSVEAQRVMDAYAARRDAVPKNGSNDALHADHIYKFDRSTFSKIDTVEDCVIALRRLSLVVCVTARENYTLEKLERQGSDGPSKYVEAGIVFMERNLLNAPENTAR